MLDTEEKLSDALGAVRLALVTGAKSRVVWEELLALDYRLVRAPAPDAVRRRTLPVNVACKSSRCSSGNEAVTYS